MFRREFDLFLTTDGASAVKLVAENQIDVIVADQRMPGMSGVEVLDQVKRISPDTSRVLLTGYADAAAVNDSINIGEVFRFLGKPCSPKVLRETLRLAVDAARPVQRASVHRIEATTALRASTHSSIEVPNNFVRDNELPELRSVSAGESPLNAISTARRSKDVGVVVYTLDSEFAEAAIRTISNKRSTLLATSLIRAMRALEEEASGVLITDVTTEFARLQRIIGALKQCVPELVTVVVSDCRDSNNMISLINYGQVFRYEQKPVTPNRLLKDIDAAAAKHINLCDNPELAKRHSVEPATPEQSMPKIPAGILNNSIRPRQERLRAIGGQL